MRATLLLAAGVFALVVMPLAGTFHCAPGWPRRAMAFYTAVLALLGIGGVVLFAADAPQAGTFGGFFLIGSFLSGFVANALGQASPRR